MATAYDEEPDDRISVEPSGEQISVEEYIKLRDASHEKLEYIDGVVYAMAGGTLAHSSIKVNLTGELRSRLRGSGCRVQDSDLQLMVSEGKYFYPDASVTCGEQQFPQPNALGNPTLIFEVLSPSTANYDRSVKLPAYLKIPSIVAVALIHSESYFVELFAQSRDDGGELIATQFRSFAGLDETVDLPGVDAAIPMRQLYEDVTLQPPREPEPKKAGGTIS